MSGGNQSKKSLDKEDYLFHLTDNEQHLPVSGKVNRRLMPVPAHTISKGLNFTSFYSPFQVCGKQLADLSRGIQGSFTVLPHGLNSLWLHVLEKFAFLLYPISS